MRKCALVFVTCLGFATWLFAEPAGFVFEVSDVVSLTNALKRQTSNNQIIRIAPGIYDVSEISMAGDSHLAANTGGIGRMICGTGASPEETIIVGAGAESNSGKRVLSANNNIVSNLTVTGGCVTGAGGGINSSKKVVVDCIISNNFASGAGGGVDNATLENCLIAGNRASANGGGARCANNCIAVDCVFSNNVSGAQGGGLSLGVATNCLFVYNQAARQGGGNHAAPLFRCRLIDNSCYGDVSTSGGQVYGCTLEECEIKGGGNASQGTISAGNATIINSTITDVYSSNNAFIDTTLRNCKIENVTVYGVHRPIVTKSTVINCLFVNNVSTNVSKGSQNSLASLSKLYNCTIFGHMLNQGTLLSVLATDSLAVNSIFDNVSEYAINDNLPAMTNCLWTSMKPLTATPTLVNCFYAEDVHFKDADNGDFSLLRSSLARNNGYLDEVYLSLVGEKDYLGLPRVQFSKIDIGCIECAAGNPGSFFYWR